MTVAGNRLIIRPAGADDAEPLADILNEIIQVGGMTAFEKPLSRAEFRSYFLDGADCLSCHLAEDRIDRQPVGFQALAKHVDLPEGWADIATFGRLRPKLAGVGTALFAATLEKASELRLLAINAAIRADNRGGLAFYEKMGFRTYRTLYGVPLNDGTPIDRILKRYDMR